MTTTGSEPLARDDDSERYDEMLRETILDAFDIPPWLRATWAHLDRDSAIVLPPPRGCYRHENGTWIHLGVRRQGHRCPPWARG